MEPLDFDENENEVISLRDQLTLLRMERERLEEEVKLRMEMIEDNEIEKILKEFRFNKKRGCLECRDRNYEKGNCGVAKNSKREQLQL